MLRPTDACYPSPLAPPSARPRLCTRAHEKHQIRMPPEAAKALNKRKHGADVLLLKGAVWNANERCGWVDGWVAGWMSWG